MNDEGCILAKGVTWVSNLAVGVDIGEKENSKMKDCDSCGCAVVCCDDEDRFGGTVDASDCFFLLFS